MSVTKKPFGTTRDGLAVTEYTISNAAGCSLSVLDYGCTIRTLFVPDQDGVLTDVVLGYDTVEEYEENGGYLGAVIGRYANRLGGCRFTLNGKEYTLYENDSPNHLHGGKKGFDKYVWAAEPGENSITFSRVSPDMEEGYPGNLKVSVTYTFDDENTLTLTYDAVSDADTVVNLTNHTYFNLSGRGDMPITTHTLQIFADAYTENDAHCLPTGVIAPVEGTPFDFRSVKSIGRDIYDDCVQIKNGLGYDHNFVLSGEEGVREIAIARSGGTGIEMEVFTDQPGVQFYAGNMLEPVRGKGGVQYGYRTGFCLETQHFPNSMVCKNFPSPVLKKGEPYHFTTAYRFTVK